MRIPGIIGGIAPESTIQYYRSIVAAYRARTGNGSYPALLINSIDMQKMLGLIAANNLTEVTEYLLAEVDKLARAGAQFALFASNTPHIVFADVRRRAVIPLLSIVEATCAVTVELGLKRVGLIGTSFTMQGGFYPAVFEHAGIELVLPPPEHQALIHDRYIGELIHGVFRPETRAAVLTVVEQLQANEKIDGLILGGTELPLLLRDASPSSIAFLDTTRIHVERVVAEMLE